MGQENTPRNLPLFLIDGTATGRIQAKLDNWTGVAYRIPRSFLDKCKDREDLHHCGVYLLLGEEDGEDTAYIGQASERKNGESILARCPEHFKKEIMKFCHEVVFFTTSTNDFGPTELCYLENRFWRMASDAKRFRLINSNEPSVGNATEAKRAELDRYIENAKILMNIFHFRIFDPLVPVSSESKPLVQAISEIKPLAKTPLERNQLVQTSSESKEKSVTFVLKISPRRSGVHIRAEALWENNKFTVLKGSELLERDRTGQQQEIRERRSRLLENGTLTRISNGVLRLNEDQRFDSPSAAACFVVGGSCNGRTAWKTDKGKTFAEIVANS